MQGRIERGLVVILAVVAVVSCSLTLISVVQISVEGQQYRQVIKELMNTEVRENLRDPTYFEMKEFLVRDKTDSNRGGSYICGDFANDVKGNAIAKGIRCAGVLIRFNERIFGNVKRGHAIVAFRTTDSGIIFIEPQKDKEVKVTLGVRYFRDNGLEGYINDDFDDTITEIEIYWPKS